MMTSIQESAVEKATFGGGCFWGVEETFRTTPGVIATRVGYAGGTMEHPSYEDVCTDHTGHAEVVEVTFDPAKVSYDALLDVFFRSHNPTTRNRQGPDVGSQYRSTIFTHSDAQKKAAHEKIHALDARHAFPSPIVTDVVEAGPFYEAEDYHQKYLMKRGLGSCHV